MTYWKCPSCAGERDTENNIIIATCPCCQIAMDKNPHIQKKEVEVKGDGYRSESETD